MPKKCYRRNCYFLLLKKNGITEFFYNLSIDCSCLKKKYARKKFGVTVLVFGIREAKGHFEGKLLRLCCQYLSNEI